MQKLDVYIEINGTMVYVGHINGTGPDDAVFSYTEEYVDSPDAVAVSLSLPLGKNIFSAKETRAFFDGLLPEGFTRRAVANITHIDETDYISMLKALGSECLGAIKVVAGENPISDAGYEKLSLGQVKALAAEGSKKSAEMITRTHLSLTGASGKVGLYYDKDNKAWYLPTGSAPSTHIVKQSHIRLDNIVANEQLSMMTAAELGIIVPESFIVNLGLYRDDEVLYAVSRYDRKFPEKNLQKDVLPIPMRLHQEDFGQVMGIPALHKYESKGEHYMQRMFENIRIYSSSPIEDQLRLWDEIVFNYLLGNTDGHIKNFSILYSEDLKNIRLSPAYDVLSTTVYGNVTGEMAFSIGGVKDITKIDAGSFEEAAREAGLGVKLAMKRFERLRDSFEDALQRSAMTLEGIGCDGALELRDRIMDTGGIHRIGR